MADRKFRHILPYFPWTTLCLSLLIFAFTLAYVYLPQSLTTNNLFLWISSPFNITYEASGNLPFYNVLLVVLVYLIVEIHTRNIADLNRRDSLIRNAFLLSVLSSYILSAMLWGFYGVPSAGTSILAFCILIFAAVETFYSEILVRVRKVRDVRRVMEIAFSVLMALAAIIFLAIFIYVEGNTYWYVHVLGGLIFVFLYSIYLKFRNPIDALEETIEEDVEEGVARPLHHSSVV